MTIEIEDNIGKLVSLKDIDDAISAVRQGVVSVAKIMEIPQLAVNMPNILRCLNELKTIRQRLETP